MAMTLDEQIGEVAQLLDVAERILFITGAGIAADSGLPTYRGVGGLYQDGQTPHGISIEEALSDLIFTRFPKIAWYYLWQIGAAATVAKPNFAHRAIAALVRQRPGSWVMTQNVDGLHALVEPRNLVELHGNIFRLYCTQCQRPVALEDIGGYREAVPLPPHCDHCGGMIRPDVTLFGENLPPSALAFLHDYDDHHFDLLMSIGTSAVFPYITAPIALAYQNRIPAVEINPAMTVVSDSVSFVLRLGAAEAFTRLCELTECGLSRK